ncbi:MAG: glycosyltransferase family 87 protein [Streptosporangiaceae bacterium]
MTEREISRPGRRTARTAAGTGRLAMLAGSATALITASLGGSLLAFYSREACRAGAWNTGVAQYQAHCYTDIYPLYFTEGLAAGKVPYVGHPVEYPVLIGAAMQAVAWLVRPISNAADRGLQFFDLTALMLAAFSLAAVLATAYLAGRSRRWTALLVALSPALILSAFINWDMIAMSLTVLGMAAWAGRRHVLAGALLGLAVATKFYPVFLLGPLFVLCLRAGRLRPFATATTAAVVAWLAVNLPFAIRAPSGWATFYTFNAARGADWGSIWYFFEAEHWPVLGSLSLNTLNLLSSALFAVACVLIAALALAAPRRPRVAQVFFLTVAAFLLFNKVWSPQYVIWLVPLVVLARPRLGGCLLWQIAEIGYFYAIWAYLITVTVPVHPPPGSIGQGLYFAAVLARFGTVALLCGLVVRDIVAPGHDVVRADGTDDPAGGVLDGAPDRLRLRLRPAAAAR